MFGAKIWHSIFKQNVQCKKERKLVWICLYFLFLTEIVGTDETGPSGKSIHQYERPCNTEDTKTALRKKFLRLFRKLDRDIAGFCGDGCEEDGILVSCGVQYLADAENQGRGDAERSRRDVDEVHGVSDQVRHKICCNNNDNNNWSLKYSAGIRQCRCLLQKSAL